MRSLIALLERRLGLEWREIIEWLRDSNGLAAIEAKLVSGDLAAVVVEVEAAAAKFAAEVHEAYVTSGRKAAKWLDDKVPDSLIRYDATHARVVQRAKEKTYEQIVGLVQEQREVVRAVVTEGVTLGTAPREMARDLRDSIGMSPPQARAMANYRRALEQGHWGKAKTYELRDGRADRSMQRGMELSPERIDSLTERYRVNAIAHRAETIARTEALAAANLGGVEAYTQAVERGDLEADQLVKEWHAGPLTRHARKDHAIMGRRPPIPFDQDFVLPDGSRMSGPGDPRGGPENVIQCRCASSTTFAHLDDRSDSEDAPREQESYKPPKNPKRVAAARIAAAASVERRREIYGAARDNLPRELHVAWDKDGHKFMRQEAHRIKGVKDRVNASSVMSQSFMEKYGDGSIGGVNGNEGDMSYRRAQLDSEHGESWANEQERKERKHWAAMEEDARNVQTGTIANDDDPPF